MNNVYKLTAVAAIVSMFGLTACTTEVHNHPDKGSPAVIKTDDGPDRVNVNVNDRASTSPPVQNNIKVDR